ncbi:MAG TPA: HlyD family efflux transporter periplasmic adaptor subunit [Oceanipulchritudo sp.]|nr:HlyD family efflux transporter periplasmic adaptor subunit [Oceanipulchritudo sp.]
MDIIRNDLKQKKRRRQIAIGLISFVVITILGIVLYSMDPAAPSVDRTAVWIGEVKHGPLEVNVRGIGTLVPEDLRWITAQTNGSVEEILILPGAAVEPDTVILQLGNPELEQNLRNAELQLASAEAQLANQRVREEDSLLEMEYQLAQLEASYENAKLDVRVNEELFSEGLVAERDLLRSQLAKEQLERQTEIMQRRLATRRQQVEQNLAPALAIVDQEKERVALLSQQVSDLSVRAGLKGVLQRLPLETGQQVATGTQLAQVADTTRLKAVVRIPETQAKDIQIGQPAIIDTRNGTVAGIVARVNPTVVGGTVDVDVRITGDLPRGARADLTVEGVISLASLNDVLFVGRSSAARENGTMGIFKLGPDGNTAERIQVTFGKSSVSEIQVVAGLVAGDKIILSDTSQYDDNDRLRLK